MKEMEEKTKQLLKRRPYLAQWFEEKPEAANEANQIRVKKSEPLDDKLIEELLTQTPSQIAVGRTGTRFVTKDALAMRAGHAIAKDAVYAEVSPDFVAGLDCVELHSQNSDREDYLLYPNKGRRLNDESLVMLKSEGTSNVDVQIIIGDGLAAWAVERNVQELLPVLKQELTANGMTFGKVLFVRFARVGVQDPIGVELKAKATVIFVGERPGLGTGDSLSAYIAFGPKMDQDNAEKNCISNIRKLGIQPKDAAVETVLMLKRAFLIGKGGVAAL
jgi:ethanolamine ammonia-lyase small subunit